MILMLGNKFISSIQNHVNIDKGLLPKYDPATLNKIVVN